MRATGLIIKHALVYDTSIILDLNSKIMEGPAKLLTNRPG